MQASLMLALALGVAVVACQGGGDAEQPDRRDQGRAVVQSRGSTLGADPVTLSYVLSEKQRLAVLSGPSVTEFQRDLMVDGVVTFGDYEAAILTMARCINQSGGALGEGEPKLNRRGLYTYSPSWPLDSPPGTENAVRRCIDDHVGTISLFWAEVVAVPQEELAKAMSEMGDCLKISGVTDAPDTQHPRDFHLFIRDKARVGLLTASLQEVYLACASGVEERWGIAGFAPATGG